MDNRIGAQLFTVRDTCRDIEGFDSTLKAISEIGYKIVQVSGIGPLTAEEIKKTADKYNLEVCCTHRAPDEFLPENIEKTIEFHKAIGCSIIGMGSMPPAYRESIDTVKNFIKEFNKVAEKIAEHGMTFAYHNHSFEFYKYGGKYLLDIVLKETDPKNFKLILDTYWVAFAGISPEAYMEKNADRIAVLHYKDMITEKDGKPAMTEIGNGNLCWDKIIEKSHKTSCEYAVVEQDICKGDPLDSLKISYDYLITKGFC